MKENRIEEWSRSSGIITIFFPWIITKFKHESVIRLLPRSLESERGKLETGILITAKQAASSKASSKSTRTVLLQNSVLANELEVQRRKGLLQNV